MCIKLYFEILKRKDKLLSLDPSGIVIQEGIVREIAHEIWN